MKKNITFFIYYIIDYISIFIWLFFVALLEHFIQFIIFHCSNITYALMLTIVLFCIFIISFFVISQKIETKLKYEYQKKAKFVTFLYFILAYILLIFSVYTNIITSIFLLMITFLLPIFVKQFNNLYDTKEYLVAIYQNLLDILFAITLFLVVFCTLLIDSTQFIIHDYIRLIFSIFIALSVVFSINWVKGLKKRTDTKFIEYFLAPVPFLFIYLIVRLLDI